MDEWEVYTTDVKREVVRRPTASPRPPKRTTEDKGWYKQMAAEMGTPRSVTPILKRRNIFEQDNSARSNLEQHNLTKRVLEELKKSSRMTSEFRTRPDSSMSRAYSYESESRSPTPRDRSMSPRREKNVSIGGVTEEWESSGVQEFYPHRDAHHGKVIGPPCNCNPLLTLYLFTAFTRRE